MATSGPSVHLAVCIRSGPRCLVSKIFYTSLDITFLRLYLNVAEQDTRVNEQDAIERILIADRPGVNTGTEVDPGSPVSLCEEFNAKYVTFFVCSSDTSTQPAQNDAFQVLMSASKERDHLPAALQAHTHRQLIGTDRLYNCVLQYMKSTGAGFIRDAVNSVGHNVVRTLRDALWYIDTAHQQFEERAIHLPESFSEFQGFNDYKKNRKNKPRMSAEDLDRHSQALAGLLMLPSLSASNCKILRADIDKLCVSLQAYSAYLKKHNVQQQQVHASLQPMRHPTVDSVASVIVASKATPPYTELQSHLDAVSLYEPICVNDFAPADRFQR